MLKSSVGSLREVWINYRTPCQSPYIIIIQFFPCTQIEWTAILGMQCVLVYWFGASHGYVDLVLRSTDNIFQLPPNQSRFDYLGFSDNCFGADSSAFGSYDFRAEAHVANTFGLRDYVHVYAILLVLLESLHRCSKKLFTVSARKARSKLCLYFADTWPPSDVRVCKRWWRRH